MIEMLEMKWGTMRKIYVHVIWNAGLCNPAHLIKPQDNSENNEGQQGKRLKEQRVNEQGDRWVLAGLAYEFTSLFFIWSCITVGLINVMPILYSGATLHLASLQWLVYIAEYKIWELV